MTKQSYLCRTLPHRYKFIIGGNHDFGLDNKKHWYEAKGKHIHSKLGFDHANPDKIQQAVARFESQSKSDGRNKYVEDEQVQFSIGEKVWTLYGSPWSPEFGGWAWNYKRGQEASKLNDHIINSDILLTHTPPHHFGRLDVITDGKTHVGCEDLTDKLNNGQLRPLLHCFGHIHGKQKIKFYSGWMNINSSLSPTQRHTVRTYIVGTKKQKVTLKRFFLTQLW